MVIKMVEINSIKSGKYYFKYDPVPICPQCDKPIKNKDKLFIDGTGTFLKKENIIETEDIGIYHFACLAEHISISFINQNPVSFLPLWL